LSDLRFFIALLSCIAFTTVHADTIITGGPIYTLEQRQPQVEAVLFRDDRIVFAGGLKAAQNLAKKPAVIDLKGRTMTPGIIESHGHLMGLGFSILNLDLSDASAYQGIVDQVEVAVAPAEPGQWILGRGWHQSKWFPQPEMMVGGFQTHDALSAVSPNNPVYLVHASGHAAMANAKAMEIAGVHSETEFEGDGEIIKDAKLQPTGIFNEVAQGLIAQHIPPPDETQRARALTLALEELAKYGVTSFQDAGTSKADIALFKRFLAKDDLTARVWVMLAGRDQELLLDWFRKGPEIGLGDERLTIRAIKLVSDGALGSRGAALKEEYSDRAGHFGALLSPVEDFKETAKRVAASKFQLNTHAIGDSANYLVLETYDELLGEDEARRWRLEHAHVIEEEEYK
jgi:predicted amidohydrolase YtcJ